MVLPLHVALAEKQSPPSLTTFGPYFKIDGSVEQVWKRAFIGPTGAIGSFFGREILVREVAAGSPADGLLKELDVIVAADGHELGDDPRIGVGYAVGDVQAGDGKLKLMVYRNGKFLDVTVQLPVLGPTPKNWPLEGGEKSKILHKQFCDYLVKSQSTDGEFSERPPTTGDGLILLAHPDPQYLEAARRTAYCYVRHPCGMGGMGAWSCGYTAIYLAEYYMVTGDRTVLPELERVCREIAKDQAPCGSWSHGGGVNRGYAVGGIVSACGVPCWLGMIMARNVGVPVDEQALRMAYRFFGQFADRSTIPYGDHEPYSGARGNGKDGAVTVAFDLLGDKVKTRQFGRWVTDWYSDWEGGHTGDFFSYYWNVLGGLRTPEMKDYVSMMQRHSWFFDMARSWEGAGLLNDSVDYNGRGPQFCTPAVGMPFAIATGRTRLALMGAPRSPFCPGKYSAVIEQARQLHFDRKWDEVEKVLAKRKFFGENAGQAAWILNAAKAAKASVDLTLADVQRNLESKWDPLLSQRQLEDLHVLLGKDDPRVLPLLARAKEKEAFKGYHEAAGLFANNKWLTPLDEEARKAMEKLSKDRAAGRYQELAREQLADRVGSFKFLYEIGGYFYQNGNTNQWDGGRSREYRLYKRVAEAYGGSWPQWVAKDTLRKCGFMCYDSDTLKDWTELVPISDKRGKPKSARVHFMPADGFDRGPEGWTEPGFDDSGWTEGKLPIGFNCGDILTPMPGDKRAFCARIRFNIEGTDFDQLRVLHRIRHFGNIYLNGQLLFRTLRYVNDGGYIYDTMNCKESAVELLKKGENILAIEGVWNLWWGTFDAGLYGLKTPGEKTGRKEAPAMAAAAALPPITKSERYSRQTGVDAQTEGMKKLKPLSDEKLVKQFSSEWLATRDFAAREFGARGSNCVPVLVEALKSKDWHVRVGACQSISYMGDAARSNAVSAADALVAALGDKDFFVQYMAGVALARIGVIPDRVLPLLSEIIKSAGPWWPRCAAADMFSRVDSGKITPATAELVLKAYAQEANFCTEERFANILKRWFGRLPEEMTIAQITAELAGHDGDWEAQSRMYGLLMAMGVKAASAVPVVEKALNEQAADQARAKFLKEVLAKIRSDQKRKGGQDENKEVIMGKRVIVGLVFCGLLVSGMGALATEFHVSPAGSDKNSGKAKKPFATLAQAQAAVREAKGGTVVVHAGTYYLPATLVFTSEDSGTEYRAAGDGPVVISGGMKLGLSWVAHKDGIMQAKTPAGIVIDQLFVNGKRQLMARYPNYDSKARPYGGVAKDAISPERAARWSDPAGGFVHALHGAAWGGVHYRITGKDATNAVSLEGGWQNNRGSGMHEQCRYVENVFEELDAPGEWYHNATTSTLYYFPPEDVELSKATVECARLKHLIEFSGSQQQPVRKVVLRGFTFSHAERTFMDTKEPLLRSDWMIYRGGAVFFRGAEDCSLVDCEFDQLGGNAVFVSGYNRRIAVKGCDIRGTGASAVAFVGEPKAVRNPLFAYGQNEVYEKLDKTPGPKTDDYPADCVVADCMLRWVGLVEKQAAGVQISMATGITVRHCSIYDASRAGINIGDGCWGGHVIEFCDVFDTVKETGDHGSFNSWGRDRYWADWRGPSRPIDELAKLSLLDAVKPTILRNSRWRCDSGWDVDLDDGSSNYEIYNNVFLSGGLKLREGFYRRAWNNISVAYQNKPHHPNTAHLHCWYHKEQQGFSEDEVVRNIWMAPYSTAFMCQGKWGKVLDYNLFCGLSAEVLQSYQTKHGSDTNSLVGDPMFIDPVNGDYRVQDNSPALKLGFKNFPMDQFGVQKPALKKIAQTPKLPEVKAIGAPPVVAAEAPKSDDVRYWQGATIRDIGGQEFSAFGVSKDSGGVHLKVVPVDAAAARDGFKTDDLIQSLNSKAVKGIADLLKLQNEAAGQPMVIGFVRGQKAQTLRVERYVYVVVETSQAPDGFTSLPVKPADRVVAFRKIETQPATGNEKPEVLFDGKLGSNYGPVFGNGTVGGLYKIDLGESADIVEINTWSCNFEGRRGPQSFAVFGSSASEDSVKDLSDRRKYTLIAEVDTIGTASKEFQATGIRVTGGKSFGKFRWLIWRVMPVTGAGENTAFQEIQVQAAK
ncbi:MAG: DUF6288 domain-containing protein [bacterium]